MSNFGDLNHTLTPIDDPAFVGNYKCVSNNGSLYVYRRNGAAHHANKDIRYNVTTDEWEDVGNSYPTKFGTSRTDSTVIVPTGSSSSLFFYNGNTYQCEMVNPDPLSSNGIILNSVPVDNTPPNTPRSRRGNLNFW